MLDDTIEAGSEAAQKARDAARTMNGDAAADEAGASEDSESKHGGGEAEDNPWMELTNGSGATVGPGQGGARKRKGKKK